MAVTARGRMYARLIKNKRLTLAEVPSSQVKDTKDSYKSLFNETLKE